MSATSDTCFHCGEPLRAGEVRFVTVKEEQKPVCCAGCEAVANMILGSGLDAFYRFRTGPTGRPEEEVVAAGPDQWDVYDREEVQREFVRGVDTPHREASFLFENLYCAACGWLIEHALKRVEGVREIRVNPATGRAILGWDADKVPLSSLLRRLAQLGYRPHPVQSAQAQSVVMRERRSALNRLSVAGLGMMQVMMFGVALYLGYYQDMEELHKQFLRIVSMLVATPVVLYAAMPILLGAIRDLRNRKPGMDVPVALAIFGGYFASVWLTITDGGHVYFDSITMFTFFLLVARYVEMSSRHRANETTDALARLMPATATRMEPTGERRVAVAELRAGDELLVRPGETIPADGEIVWGETTVNEAMLTGESMPQLRRVGDRVVGGSLNMTGALRMRVDRLGQDTVLSQIGRLLERAQAERPRLAQLADWVGARFVTAVLIVAAVVFAVWWQLDPSRAFPVVLSVLVATCPCALALAMPTALAGGTNRLAANGLLITRADALETLSRVTHIVFDKTGTLTHGELTVDRVRILGSKSEAECRALSAALEQHSEHPIARAFHGEQGSHETTEVRTVPGQGVEGIVGGRRYRIGTAAFVAELLGSFPTLPEETAEGSWVALADEQELLALFRLVDRPRAELQPILDALRRQGIKLSIASGDSAPAVQAVAAELGIEDWRARQTPMDKLAYLRELQSGGAVVAMVGDGINDAPVLAGANVSIAMNSGTALAQTSASMVLLGDTLRPLQEGIATARKTMRVVRQNMMLSVAYNLSVLPAAAMGMLPPWGAAIGMTLSSLVVVLNARRVSPQRRDDITACPVPLAGLPKEARA